MLGFLTRDLALFVLMRSFAGGKGDFAALAVIAALYLLLPAILQPLAPALTALFLPTPGSILSPVAAWLQGLVVAGLALSGLRSRQNPGSLSGLC